MTRAQNNKSEKFEVVFRVVTPCSFAVEYQLSEDLAASIFGG